MKYRCRVILALAIVAAFMPSARVAAIVTISVYLLWEDLRDEYCYSKGKKDAKKLTGSNQSANRENENMYEESVA